MTIPREQSYDSTPFYSYRQDEELSCFGDCPNVIIQSAFASFFEIASMVTKIGQSLFQNCFEDMRETPPRSESHFELRLKEVKATAVLESTVSKEFSNIRSSIINSNSPRDLFGIQADDPLDHSEIMKKYRKTVIVIHPDKNPENELEASRLFHCVQEAYEELNKEINKS